MGKKAITLLAASHVINQLHRELAALLQVWHLQTAERPDTVALGFSCNLSTGRGAFKKVISTHWMLRHHGCDGSAPLEKAGHVPGLAPKEPSSLIAARSSGQYSTHGHLLTAHSGKWLSLRNVRGKGKCPLPGTASTPKFWGNWFMLHKATSFSSVRGAREF